MLFANSMLRFLSTDFRIQGVIILSLRLESVVDIVVLALHQGTVSLGIQIRMKLMQELLALWMLCLIWTVREAELRVCRKSSGFSLPLLTVWDSQTQKFDLISCLQYPLLFKLCNWSLIHVARCRMLVNCARPDKVVLCCFSTRQLFMNMRLRVGKSKAQSPVQFLR